MVQPIKREKELLENLVPRKMLGLLLKKELSASDLADRIYGNRNVRSKISPYLKQFKENGWVTKRNTFTKSILYKAKFEVLGSFNQKEKDFIELIIRRFWNPSHALNDDLIDSLIDLILSAIFIKKTYWIKKKVTQYNPSEDLKFYKENKKRFWIDSKFCDNFLDNIKDKGESKDYDVKTFHVSNDFVFVSLFAPDSLFSKINGKHHNKTNPLYILFKIFSS